MIFKKEEQAQILGCKIISGKIEKNVFAVVLRANEFIEKGKISDLQIGKEAVADAVKGQECGIRFVGQPKVEVGDILDIYKEKEIKRVI
jgi:translation initiation factor IF-2